MSMRARGIMSRTAAGTLSCPDNATLLAIQQYHFKDNRNTNYEGANPDTYASISMTNTLRITPYLAALVATACIHSPQPFTVQSFQRTTSDTLGISVLKYDLHNKHFALTTIIAKDPDGNGPAEAALTDPLSLAREAHVIAAVNTNAFAGLPDSTGKRDSNWHAGQYVDIVGVAVHDGVARSRYDNSSVADISFGITQSGAPYLGPATSAPKFVEAVNGWSIARLVENGVAIPKSGGQRNPRTAIGLDKSRRWLYLVVVDGRQPGYSNGVTPFELANEMIRIGCYSALNVDGGGSSIMLVADSSGALRTVNRPSGGSRRPIPVMLGIIRKHE